MDERPDARKSPTSMSEPLVDRRVLIAGAALLGASTATATTAAAPAPPILVLDMYEHAYEIDYGAKAGVYVDAFMAAIRWPAADERFERV